MIELFPAKCHEILHCSGSVWAGVMNNHNTPAKHATSPILFRATQFFKCVTIDACVDCGALGQEVHKQNTFSDPKHCAHDLPSWSGLLEFRLCWVMKCASTPWTAASIQGLCTTPMSCPLWLHVSRSYRLPHYIVSESPMHWPAVSICVLHKHLRHPACTQFPKLKFIRHNFVKKWPWNLRKCRESDVMVDRLFSLIFSSTACTKSSLTRRSAAQQIITHIFTPSLNSPTHLYHWSTHGMFSIHVTQLTNFSQFHVLHIQEMDYRPYFTCSRILCFLKHYKRTARCVNTVQMSAKLDPCLATESTNSARVCTIMTAALQWQYLQMELIFWLTLIYSIMFMCICWFYLHIRSS